MSGTAELLTFAGVMALGQFSPGPDMVLLTRTALKSGVRSGVKMACGIACGLSVHAVLAVGGLALAFDQFPELRESLRWGAAIYLMYLAYHILKEVMVPVGGPAARMTSSARSNFQQGLLCNLLNPKVAIFLAAASAPFLRGERPDGWELAILGIVVGQGFLLWSFWAWLLQWPPLRTRYERAARGIDAVFGIALLALASRLMLG